MLDVRLRVAEFARQPFPRVHRHHGSGIMVLSAENSVTCKMHLASFVRTHLGSVPRLAGSAGVDVDSVVYSHRCKRLTILHVTRKLSSALHARIVHCVPNPSLWATATKATSSIIILSYISHAVIL